MNTTGARQIATSSMLLLAENLIRLIAVAVISFWIARQLGPGQFGILNFASAFAAILLAVSTLGMDTPVILRLTQSREPFAVMGAVLALRIGVSVIVFIAACLIALLMKHDDSVALSATVIVSLGILLNSPSVFDYWFKANTMAAPPALARICGTLLSAGVKILCLLSGLGVEALAWTITLEAALTSIGLTLVYQRATRKQRYVSLLTVDWLLLKEIAIDSWPYMMSVGAIILYMKVDIVMLGYMSTNTETGIYSLAQKLSEVLYIVPVVLVDSAYPLVAKRFLGSKSNDSNQGQMLFDLAVAGSLISCVFALLLSGPIINIVFGKAYLPSVHIFYLHAWSCVAIAMNSARMRWLATTGLQRFAPIVTGVGVVINVAMNIALIPTMGAQGAAIATVVSYFISGYLSSFLIPSLRLIGLMQSKALWPWKRLYSAATIRRVN